MTRFIRYMCDFCGKNVTKGSIFKGERTDFTVRIERNELEPIVLQPLGRYEVCPECIELAQDNLKQRLELKRLQK